MFKLITVSHVVKIPPSKFSENIEEAAFEILSNQFNGQIHEDLGFVICVTDIIELGIGKILHGDAATYHPVKFIVLAFEPIQQEVVEGTVVEIVDFGAFIRLGPSDGLVHVSQITDSFMRFENMTQRFISEEGDKILTIDDIVRARIIAVSLGTGRAAKLGLTMRQPYLGKLEWIEEKLGLKDGQLVEDEIIED